MPTGYTAIIGEQDNLTFPEFVMTCARAFGACVEMREDPINKAIPDEFVPSDYHQKEIVNHEKRLSELKKMSIKLASVQSHEEYESEISSHNSYLCKKAALKKKYQSMLSQVKKWQAPTADHLGLKNFMIEQIEGSIKFDCSDYFSAEPTEKTGKQWLHDAIEREIKDIAYHTKEYAEEVERINDRNEWLRALRESLKEKP
jgi:hypothetical protein